MPSETLVNIDVDNGFFCDAIKPLPEQNLK